MSSFEGFAKLAEFIREVKPSGSFSANVKLVIVSGKPIRRYEWRKGCVTRDLGGRFMTWAKTGGILSKIF